MPDDLGEHRLAATGKRRRQLLDTALLIVPDERADRLTLGHLAARAGVSKPVTYDHFGTMQLNHLARKFVWPMASNARFSITVMRPGMDKTDDKTLNKLERKLNAKRRGFE